MALEMWILAFGFLCHEKVRVALIRWTGPIVIVLVS